MSADAERLAALADERHISLTTLKRDGTTASTPVWVVTDDGRHLLVWSGSTTWKVKRLLRKKYGLLKRLLDAFNTVVRVLSRRPKSPAEYIEITPRAS
jgi:hypothetical protein